MNGPPRFYPGLRRIVGAVPSYPMQHGYYPAPPPPAVDPYRQPWEQPPYNPQPPAYVPVAHEGRSTGFHEGQNEFAHQRDVEGMAVTASDKRWDDTRTERWGDADRIQFTSPASLVGFTQAIVTKQLARAHSPKPVIWLVQFNTADGFDDANVVPAAEVGPIFLDFAVTVGCGMSKTTFIQRLPLAAANAFNIGPPGTLPPSLNVPAEDIQVIAQLRGFTVPASTYQIAAACMIAPLGIKF